MVSIPMYEKEEGHHIFREIRYVCSDLRRVKIEKKREV
jgi:hypothetical protein